MVGVQLYLLAAFTDKLTLSVMQGIDMGMPDAPSNFRPSVQINLGNQSLRTRSGCSLDAAKWNEVHFPGFVQFVPPCRVTACVITLDVQVRQYL